MGHNHGLRYNGLETSRLSVTSEVHTGQTEADLIGLLGGGISFGQNILVKRPGRNKVQNLTPIKTTGIVENN